LELSPHVNCRIDPTSGLIRVPLPTGEGNRYPAGVKVGATAKAKSLLYSRWAGNVYSSARTSGNRLASQFQVSVFAEVFGVSETFLSVLCFSRRKFDTARLHSLPS